MPITSRRTALKAMGFMALMPGVVLSVASGAQALSVSVSPRPLPQAITNATAGGVLLREGDWSAGSPLIRRGSPSGW